MAELGRRGEPFDEGFVLVLELDVLVHLRPSEETRCHYLLLRMRMLAVNVHTLGLNDPVRLREMSGRRWPAMWAKPPCLGEWWMLPPLRLVERASRCFFEADSWVRSSN